MNADGNREIEKAHDIGESEPEETLEHSSFDVPITGLSDDPIRLNTRR
jgi:hypothetical protein